MQYKFFVHFLIKRLIHNLRSLFRFIRAVSKRLDSNIKINFFIFQRDFVKPARERTRDECNYLISFALGSRKKVIFLFNLIGHRNFLFLVLKQPNTNFDKKISPQNFLTKRAIIFAKYCNKPVKKKLRLCHPTT